MATTHNLGFPRIGARRELKKALDGYWAGRIGQDELLETGRRLRAEHWRRQQILGIDWIPVGDFAFYDQMLNMTALLGAVPARFGRAGGTVDLDTYFAMARGTATQPALSLKKWFDTNYHYLTPELTAETRFRLAGTQLFDEVDEALALGIPAKPVLIGPLTWLYLGKEKAEGFDRLDLLPRLVPAYQEILARLKAQGVSWVQIDEPVLGLDLPGPWRDAIAGVYRQLAAGAPRLLLATYFESVASHASLLKSLPVAGLHIDLARAPRQLDAFLDGYPADKILSLGVVDGRNIWRNDLSRSLEILAHAQEFLAERLWLAPSCSLLHVPADLSLEDGLDDELRGWLAFAVQKLEEVAVLRRGLGDGRETVRNVLEASYAAARARRESARIHDAAVARRVAGLKPEDARRRSPFPERQRLQRGRFQLPALPTTTIGSFPQTAEIRAVRARFKAGEIGGQEYRQAMRAEIRLAVERQEALGLDVLVHGEAERNDMVEYFGEQLSGFAFTRHGWVQSYGSRCVKPPILYGDVSRPAPMTVEWTAFAQSCTGRPMKGMLTGPITILQWSFVRDDQPRRETALQIALAIRDEVADLEKAGIGIIQIDEPAIREGLPLKRADREDYLAWAGFAFRLAASGVADGTQIHSHFCYSDFGTILPTIAALDADVVTIESSRADMEVLDAFRTFRYPNEIGPGVYDIHSPRIPSTEEMARLLAKAATFIDAGRLWVNPDCGLKTRGWAEVEAALGNMVAAAKILRERLAAEPALPHP